VPYLKLFVAEFEGKADFLTVYIEEAHAVDEWPIGSRLKYTQPKTMEERFVVIQDFCAALEFDLPLAADLVGVPEFPDNDFGKKYCPWPIRLYVIHEGKMEYIAEPMLGTFSLSGVRETLEAIFARQ